MLTAVKIIEYNEMDCKKNAWSDLFLLSYDKKFLDILAKTLIENGTIC